MNSLSSIKYYLTSAVFLLPVLANAQDTATALAYDFVNTFNDVILFPTIALLSALAILLFLFGAFQYVVNAADPAARQQGVKHITWSIVGLVVMLSAYTILLLFANTFGLGDELDGANQGDSIYTPPGTGTTPQGGVAQPSTPAGGVPQGTTPQGGVPAGYSPDSGRR